MASIHRQMPPRDIVKRFYCCGVRWYKVSTKVLFRTCYFGSSIYIHGLSEVETSGDSVQNESEKEEIGENEKLKRNKTAIIIRNRIKDKLEGRDPDGNTQTSVKQQVNNNHLN